MIRGTFLGLEIARKGLLAARAGLDTVGHNIANANTEGYSRQRVVQRAASPLSMPGPFVTMRPGQIGTGVEVISVTRIRSSFIEAQMHQEQSGLKQFESMSAVYTRIEDIIGEPGDGGVGTLMESYFNAWEDLGNDPESASARSNLRETAVALTDAVQGIDLKFEGEIRAINMQLSERVSRVNDLAGQLASLNEQIMAVESGSSAASLKANDLKDRRDSLAGEISALINTRVQDNGNGSISLLVDGHPLVSGQFVNEIGLRPDPSDPARPMLEFKGSHLPVPLRSGEMAGLVQMRDVEIPAVRHDFSKLVTAFGNQVNSLHQQGYGLDGQKGRLFFASTETRTVQGTQPLPAATTGETAINTLGISAGDFFVQGQRIEITHDETLPGSALTVSRLLERIEAAAPDIRARLDTSQGFPRIVISQLNPVSGDTPLELKDGSSSFFEVSGLDKARVQEHELDPPYTNSLAGFRVSSSIMNSLNAIAAAGDDGLGFPGPGDNRMALSVSNLKNRQNAVDGTSFGGYFQGMISTLGSAASTVQRATASRSLMVEQIESRRQEVSGVSLDEEAVNLIKYQKAFEASARAVSVIDQTLSLIVSGLGSR